MQTKSKIEWQPNRMVMLKDLAKSDFRYPTKDRYINRKYMTSQEAGLFKAIDGEDYGYMSKLMWDATNMGGLFCKPGFKIEYINE